MFVFKVRDVSEVRVNNALPYIERSDSSSENDWIILKLDSPLHLGENVQPACLPPSTSYLPLSSTKQQCWTSGWGLQVEGEAYEPKPYPVFRLG